jgi:hypothetical protein
MFLKDPGSIEINSERCSLYASFEGPVSVSATSIISSLVLSSIMLIQTLEKRVNIIYQ